MHLQDIPALNATLNGLATVLLTIGFVLIKRGQRVAHRKVMTAACLVSAVFLVSYVSHKMLMRGAHTPFGGVGFVRTAYLLMLLTHSVLAMAIVWLVPRTFWFAIKGDYARHRAWARWTFPIWYYVSITGVLIYFCLYQWWPAAK